MTAQQEADTDLGFQKRKYMPEFSFIMEIIPILKWFFKSCEG